MGLCVQLLPHLDVGSAGGSPTEGRLRSQRGRPISAQKWWSTLRTRPSAMRPDPPSLVLFVLFLCVSLAFKASCARPAARLTLVLHCTDEPQHTRNRGQEKK